MGGMRRRQRQTAVAESETPLSSSELVSWVTLLGPCNGPGALAGASRLSTHLFVFSTKGSSDVPHSLHSVHRRTSQVTEFNSRGRGVKARTRKGNALREARTYFEPFTLTMTFLSHRRYTGNLELEAYFEKAAGS